jgi:hypothetical protein
MKRIALLVLAGLFAAGVAVAGEGGDRPDALVVTGGHPFDKKKFGRTFERCTEMGVSIIDHKEFTARLDDGSAADAAVVVLFSYSKKLTKDRREAFKDMINGGTGLVVLHHAIIGYPKWLEFSEILGGRYFHNTMEWKGETYDKSDFKHDVDMSVHVADPDHPITRGMEDFEVHDETYSGMWVAPDNRVLLTTDAESGDPQLMWVRTWQDARTAYMQLGHGPSVYGQKPYQVLVRRAMRWTAGLQPVAPERE